MYTSSTLLGVNDKDETTSMVLTYYDISSDEKGKEQMRMY